MNEQKSGISRDISSKQINATIVRLQSLMCKYNIVIYISVFKTYDCNTMHIWFDKHFSNYSMKYLWSLVVTHTI